MRTKFTLQQLLSMGIFTSYEILTPDTKLDRSIKYVSILETPDFKNYIIEDSLILTTFYTIQTDESLFFSLLESLHQKGSCGLCIKLHRYIDEIPDRIIKQANLLDIPIIILNYDANLSTLFSVIYAEIQSRYYLDNDFHTNFIRILRRIDKNPSTSALVEKNMLPDNFHVLFYNYETGTLRYSDDQIMEFFNADLGSSNSYMTEDNYIIYSENIFDGDKKIYQMIIKTRHENNNLLYTYSEIYKIMIAIIYQKKNEFKSKQDQFLIRFFSKVTTLPASNEQLIDDSKIFNWKIEFPVILVILSFSKNIEKLIEKDLFFINSIRDKFIREFKINKNEIKYVHYDNQLLFILNHKITNYLESINKVFEFTVEKLDSDEGLIVIDSEPLALAEVIPSYYNSMLDSSRFLLSNCEPNIRRVLHYDTVIFYKIISELNNDELEKIVNLHLERLIEYEKQYNISLIDTLHALFQSKFNLQTTSKRLFIHYNTLRYRIKLLQDFGYDVFDPYFNYLPLYNAIVVHKQKKRLF